MYGRDTLPPVSSSTGAHHHWHPSHPRTLLAVAAGGAVGAVLRWALEVALPTTGLPWVTLLVNVVGCAALAVLVVHDDRHRHPRWLRPGVGTGLLGGFTTFSTYAVQVAALSGPQPRVALVYLVVTPVLCVAAAGVAGALALRAGR
ncbi:hypothetical protein GCM10011366_02410 [Ornithinimicrobium tianjinense]|uniref:Fluoride-specific ion channel FluC n=1 Tax=Ornithinimicrobium tianjinense TaxID=1195761 RepID=A0A917F2H2_9MICO|nr:hypothetical protein GCM10011366_02410 [Ornithinimicrobium tianjinense]